MIRVLLLSTLYPSAARPRHGLFVARRFAELLRTGEVSGAVICPTPHGAHGAPGAPGGPVAAHTAGGAAAPQQVLYPRFRTVRGLGGIVHPWTVTRAACAAAAQLPDRFDVVDGHYLFPDGVAATRLARRLRLPVVLTARGSDVNVHAAEFWAGRWTRRALDGANQVACVSAALRDKLLDLGVPAERLHVLRNGVDLEAFRPVAPAARGDWMRDPARRLLLMVGHLNGIKGQHHAIAALGELPDCELALVGEGTERTPLAQLAARLGVADRVHFLGARDAAELPAIYAAADALWMASCREGMPNVVLESLACGTPVCGVAVGGVPEVVDGPAAGRLRPSNRPADLAAAARELFAAPPERSAVRAHAERFSWQATTQGQRELFRRAIAEGPRR